MPRGRAKPPLVLTEEERETLERWARRPTTAQALALRARIVLRCAFGQQNQNVAREIGVTPLTVGRWRQRFVTKRVDGLLDEPRPGAPRTVTDAAVERVVRLTLETTPQDATHWSTRAMAKRCGLSQSAVSRIWRAFALRPHRVETFKLSKDPLFIEKVRDIVGLYLDPPDKAFGAVRGRESADSGPRSVATSPADAAGAGRATDARLHTPRHNHALRGPERQERQGHQRVSPAPTRHRVSEISRHRRRRRAGAAGSASQP